MPIIQKVAQLKEEQKLLKESIKTSQADKQHMFNQIVVMEQEITELNKEKDQHALSYGRKLNELSNAYIAFKSKRTHSN